MAGFGVAALYRRDALKEGRRAVILNRPQDRIVNYIKEDEKQVKGMDWHREEI